MGSSSESELSDVVDSDDDGRLEISSRHQKLSNITITCIHCFAHGDRWYNIECFGSGMFCHECWYWWKRYGDLLRDEKEESKKRKFVFYDESDIEEKEVVDTPVPLVKKKKISPFIVYLPERSSTVVKQTCCGVCKFDFSIPENPLCVCVDCSLVVHKSMENHVIFIYFLNLDCYSITAQLDKFNEDGKQLFTCYKCQNIASQAISSVKQI